LVAECGFFGDGMIFSCEDAGKNSGSGFYRRFSRKILKNIFEMGIKKDSHFTPYVNLLRHYCSQKWDKCK